METYIFTFGIGQKHERQAIEIVAEDYEQARGLMIENFGTEWAFQYEYDDYHRICKEMNMQPYPVIQRIVANANEEVTE